MRRGLRRGQRERARYFDDDARVVGADIYYLGRDGDAAATDEFEEAGHIATNIQSERAGRPVDTRSTARS